MRMVTFCLLLGIIFSCSENRAHSEDIPEGKIYSYKEEHGATREMEIHFPQGHESTNDSAPGLQSNGKDSGTDLSFRRPNLHHET